MVTTSCQLSDARCALPAFQAGTEYYSVAVVNKDFCTATTALADLKVRPGAASPTACEAAADPTSSSRPAHCPFRARTPATPGTASLLAGRSPSVTWSRRA